MYTDLASFQDGFSQALLAPDPAAVPALAPDIAALVRQPGFAVYRNTVMKGCIDALQANYPAVARLVGDEWFRAAAAVFVRGQLPSQATLLYYGEAFADFLARFEPAADLPYLSGVARLDRCWTGSHAAPDEAALAPAALAGLAPEAFAAIVLHPHAAARWAWFADQPIYTIWHRNREARDDSDDASHDDANNGSQDDSDNEREIVWRSEGALLTRPRGAVQWSKLGAAGCAFLDACAAGRPLTEAAAAARAAQENADLAQMMKILLGAGAFGRISEIRTNAPNYDL